MAEHLKLASEDAEREQNSEARPTCILVLGMHRSGTSAITRVLNLAGASLPNNLLGADRWNEGGTWESLALLAYHDGLLAELGSSWDDSRALEMGKLRPHRREEVRSEIAGVIRSEYGDAGLFVVKDPRICRFARLTITALRTANIDVRVVIPFRNPLEVCDSLERRDGMPKTRAAMLWLRHVLDAEAAGRDAKHVFVSYSSLLTDWQATLERVSEQIGVPWPYGIEEIKPQVERYLQPTHRHFNRTAEEVILDPVLKGWVADAYAVLQILENNPESETARKQLDQIRQEVEKAGPLFESLISEANVRRSQDESEIAELKDEIAGSQNELERTREEVETKASEIARLTGVISEAQSDAARARNEVVEKDGMIAGLKTEVTGLAEEVSWLKSLIQHRDREVGGLQRQLSERQLALQTEVDGAAALHAEIDRLKADLQAVNADLDSYSRKLSRRTREVVARDERIAELQRGLRNAADNVELANAAFNQLFFGDDKRIDGRMSAPALVRKAFQLVVRLRSRKFRENTRYASDLKTIATSALFDSKFYLRKNADVAAAKVNPLLHFVLHGAYEKRDPGPGFSTSYYLENNPDVAASGVNPLVHYIRHGAAEGRTPVPPLFKRPVPDAEEEPAASPSARPLDASGDSEIASLDTASPIASGPTPLPGRAKLRRVVWLHDADNVDTSRRRIFGYVEALAVHDVETAVIDHTQLDLSGLSDIDLLVISRLGWSDKLADAVAHARERACPVIFDLDEVLFDPELFQHDAVADPHAVATQFKQTLIACDAVTVPTFALAEEVGRLGKPAYVLPNVFSGGEIGSAEQAAEVRAASVHERGIRIACFSGPDAERAGVPGCRDALVRLMEERDDVTLHWFGAPVAVETFDRFGNRFSQKASCPQEERQSLLAEADIVVVPRKPDLLGDSQSELAVVEAAMFGIPSVASPTTTLAAVIQHQESGLLAATSDQWYDALSSLVTDPALRDRIGCAAKAQILPRYTAEHAVTEMLSIYQAAFGGRLRAPAAPDLVTKQSGADQPVVSVVSSLYGKAQEIRYFLEAFRRQDFPAPFEVILVDDRSPDNSVAVVEDYLHWLSYAPAGSTRMTVRIVRNERNLGNCGSRNVGITESKGAIVVVIDADCLVNRSYLSSHYAAFQKGDADAVIGPINLETAGEPPMGALGRYEADVALAHEDSNPQDSTVPHGFVNCITRNFSIRRGFIDYVLKEPLFDDAFAYSANPESGFGWEDVEMGTRLYEHGARIKYLPETVSLHISHPPTEHGTSKPLRSLKNFRRLHEKHPELALSARQWSFREFDAIVSWARNEDADVDENEDYAYLEPMFRGYKSPIVIKKSRPLRILSYRWHCSHQYELFRLGHDFTLVTGAGTGMCEGWDYSRRPMPRNARFVPADQIDPRDYDAAILHFDENVIHHELCNNVISADWGANFKWLLEHTSNLPRVAVCHGTPQFVGQYDRDYEGSDLGQVYEASRAEMVDLLGDIPVVCNSHQAKHEWNFRQGRCIWHGFSPYDIPKGRHDSGVLTLHRDAMYDRPFYNGWFVFRAVQELLDGQVNIEHRSIPDPEEGYVVGTNDWASAKFQNYVRTVGRYGVYLNPTLRSPMPRSRGEAMMAGVVPVSMRNHDVDLFIHNGINGFYADEPAELAEQVRYLMDNPQERERMSAEARRTALDLFNLDRYHAHWSALLHDIVS